MEILESIRQPKDLKAGMYHGVRTNAREVFNIPSLMAWGGAAMKGGRLYVVLMWLALLCIGCGAQGSSHLQKRTAWMQPNGKLKVLSTIAMIDDIVKGVGGEYVDSYTLIQGDLDPHSYQLVKGDDETLFFADIVFYNGLGLEHGPSLQAFLQNSQKSIALGDEIRESDPELILQHQTQLDPHIWMDVSLWAKTVPFIVEALSRKDPEHAAEYQRNGKQLFDSLMLLHAHIKAELQAIPESQRFLVSSHDAFHYFARSYLATPEEISLGSWAKRVAAPEGLAPESQLSVTDIQMIISHLQKHDIHIIFPESNVSKDSIRKILQASSEIGLQLKIACVSLYADAMGPPGSGGETYVEMILHNAKTIAFYLKKNTSSGDFCEP